VEKFQFSTRGGLCCQLGWGGEAGRFGLKIVAIGQARRGIYGGLDCAVCGGRLIVKGACLEGFIEIRVESSLVG